MPFQPTRRTFANMWTEYEPNKRVLLPKGWRQGFSRLRLREAIIWDKDVPVEMRDGTILRVDIFRPASKEHERLPALVPWSPYGKTGTGLLQTKDYAYVGVPPTQTSGLEKFEAPDPADWCARGYAVVQADARGTFNSEGDMFQFGTQVDQLPNSLEGLTAADSGYRKHRMGMILLNGRQSRLGAMRMLQRSEILGLASCSGIHLTASSIHSDSDHKTGLLLPRNLRT